MNSDVKIHLVMPIFQDLIEPKNFREFLVTELEYEKIKSKKELIEIVEGLTESFVQNFYSELPDNHFTGMGLFSTGVSRCSIKNLKYPDFCKKYGLEYLTSCPDRFKEIFDSVVNRYVFLKVRRLKKSLERWEA